MSTIQLPPADVQQALREPVGLLPVIEEEEALPPHLAEQAAEISRELRRPWC